jgi:hypothetical protein
MDVYHKVLLKLYQVTGGRDSQTVDLKDLVKSLGFLGNYDDIFQMLNGQGWIADTPKLNFVRMTHWGVKEAHNSESSEPGTAAPPEKNESAHLIAETKQFLTALEKFASNSSKENFWQIEKKINEINAAIANLKTSIE